VRAKRTAWFLSVLLVVLESALLLAAPPASQRYALLVGVKEYHHPKLLPLHYTENDVAQLKDLLRSAGYEVTLLCDSEGERDPRLLPTLANIRAQLSTVLSKCERRDTVLIGLAGHGLQFETLDDSFFCPADARPFPEQAPTLLSLKGLYRELDQSNAGVKLLLVDACRDDPTQGRGGRRGIDADSVPIPPRGVAALFSCSAGQVAYEHKKYEHGIFFHFVLEGLRGKANDGEGEVTWDSLQAFVRKRVSREVPKLIGEGAKQDPNLVGVNQAGLPAVLLTLRDSGSQAAVPDDTRFEGKEFTNAAGMEFVRLEAGKFTMGSPRDEAGRFGNEERHEVTLTRDYYLGKYPVTRGQFARFLAQTRTRSQAENDGQGGWGYDPDLRKIDGPRQQYTWMNPGFPQQDDHPVVNVTWNDADAFCRWLRTTDKRDYRLPTEAEWEYACRAGKTTRYFTGDSEDSLRGYANVADQALKGKLRESSSDMPQFHFNDGYAFTSPVGRFKPNSFGLHDMTGNVWQWCADWFGEYDLEDSKDPKGPNKGNRRVLRGGSWCGSPRHCRSACRGVDAPANCVNFVGFRVAVTARAP